MRNARGCPGAIDDIAPPTHATHMDPRTSRAWTVDATNATARAIGILTLSTTVMGQNGPTPGPFCPIVRDRVRVSLTESELRSDARSSAFSSPSKSSGRSSSAPLNNRGMRAMDHAQDSGAHLLRGSSRPSTKPPADCRCLRNATSHATPTTKPLPAKSTDASSGTTRLSYAAWRTALADSPASAKFALWIPCDGVRPPRVGHRSCDLGSDATADQRREPSDALEETPPSSTSSTSSAWSPFTTPCRREDQARRGSHLSGAEPTHSLERPHSFRERDFAGRFEEVRNRRGT